MAGHKKVKGVIRESDGSNSKVVVWGQESYSNIRRDMKDLSLHSVLDKWYRIEKQKTSDENKTVQKLAVLWGLVPETVPKDADLADIISPGQKMLIFMTLLRKGLIDGDTKTLENIFNKLMAADKTRRESRDRAEDGLSVFREVVKHEEMAKEIQEVKDRFESGEYPVAATFKDI